MSDYSGYQRKRAHALGPFASVYEATAPNGGPGRFALKIFHPPASTDISRLYLIEGWLLAAERQQKAAKKDGAVLEVIAFGRCPEGAYAVTPWQENSLESFVSNLAARGDLLRALAESLFNALEQWGAQTGGSHRKLKPSNIFPARSGPLAGLPLVLSDPWFQLGLKADKSRVNDLTAVGAILAQVVRRREVAAWPIEDAPEWKALGRAGKAWLAYVNFLLDPQPATGELTIAEARKRLRAIPKDSNPVRTAVLTGATVVMLAVGGVLAFARFGNPIYMTDQIEDLANKMGNPRAQIVEVPRQWAELCVAWDTWLVDLQGNAKRLLRTEGLLEPTDPLRRELENFVATSNELRPEFLVPAAAGEQRLGVLAKTPPEAVLKELLTPSVFQRVQDAGARLVIIQSRLVGWQKWDQLRTLQRILEDRGFTRAAAALAPKLPQAPGTPGYKLDVVRTLTLLNDISLDTAGTLPLAGRWSEITRLGDDMVASGDRVQQAMPVLIMGRLVDRGSLADFADSLVGPLEEMKLRRKMFLDPQVVRERFLKDSALLRETAAVTADDFPRWEEELALFSKVPAADDPRVVPTLAAKVTSLSTQANDLEADAPAPEPGGPATLSRPDFDRELGQWQGDLTTLRSREIVRIDLPDIKKITDQMTERLTVLEQRVAATIVLLDPQRWLDKVGRAYGEFNETRQRWAAWQQAALNGVTAAALDGRINPANRDRFRALRADERKVREWIDGLQGPDGLAALVVPDISGASADTAGALRQLEAARREKVAADAAAAVEWRAGVPVVTWSAGSATVREPLEAHRQWLAGLPGFAAELDRLGGLLADGFSWTEGISDVIAQLSRRPGLDALTGKPAEWNTEARLLGTLVDSTDRAVLADAAGSGGLSRRLTAWRRLGTLPGWPANAADLDVDGGVVSVLRENVGRDVKEATRQLTLLDELTRETRMRWNRAARNSAGDIAQMSAVFERMATYRIAENDLEENALYNLKLWQLKRSDWSEVDLAPLRARRDAFVATVRGISGVAGQPAVAEFVQTLAGIELIVDPNRKPTPSPRLAGWTEELTDAGLGLTAIWDAGGKSVKLDFSIVQPADNTPPFYLAKREIAVGEFLDLMAARPKEAGEVMAALPAWARGYSLARPYDQLLAWRPQTDYRGLELNPSWFHEEFLTAPVKGLFDNPELTAKGAPLEKAKAEKPTPRSPLQQIPPAAAKIFVEKMLGARLPTVAEWEAVMQTITPAATGNFRSPSFQDLFKYLREYDVAGQTLSWRPNAGSFQVMVPSSTGGRPVPMPDDGQAAAGAGGTRLWLAPVDEGPATATGGFVNLTGNVWIYLQGSASPGSAPYFVAGGSAFAPPGLDPRLPQKVAGSGLIGGAGALRTEGYSDVGVRPAFDAPPGFKERYKFLELVRKQGFLTW